MVDIPMYCMGGGNWRACGCLVSALAEWQYLLACICIWANRAELPPWGSLSCWGEGVESRKQNK